MKSVVLGLQPLGSGGTGISSIRWPGGIRKSPRSLFQPFCSLLGDDETMGERGVRRIALPVASFDEHEAMAVVILRWTPEYANAELVRSSDPEAIRGCQIKINVANADVDACCFQSSSGSPVSKQVYVSFGSTAMDAKLAGVDPMDHQWVRHQFRRVFIDDYAGDCHRVAQFLDPVDETHPELRAVVFDQLVGLIEDAANDRLSWILKKILPGRDIIRRAMADRQRLLPSGEIAYIPQTIAIEWHRDLLEGVKYFAMPRAAGDFGVYAVWWKSGSKAPRLRLAGKRDEALTATLQGMMGTGWIYPKGTCGVWSTQANAIEYLRQICKPGAHPGAT